MRDCKLSVGLDDPAFGVSPRFIDLKWFEARVSPAAVADRYEGSPITVLLPRPIEGLNGEDGFRP